MLDALSRITNSFNSSNTKLVDKAIQQSFLVSADMAHAIHPNYMDKHEDNHQPKLHGGLGIKHNANQRYVTNAITSFIFREIAERHDLPIQPISQNKRYVVRNGMPQLIPSNPVALIKSNILSTQLKLKILLEPLSWWHSNKRSFHKGVDTGVQESVGQFFKRHFGTEVVDYMIDPFVAGTSAGDPESLSMRHAFRQLWNLEKK
ncbi:protoporphyrinogen oxidase 2-like [Dendrobium catenatum]|uniref:protoporphyrinogen oxidase 2-like n=1 Tax=Dendrobium catenatum TaxID=906689 RepID=UPI00109F7B18|nr:protoporphyrinogen oxidase 2-like [Dendrobium catenatum]XP_028550122.1 protoporphyrinogen oxidase 2-like [Dendrobium catenatum]XP_028550123.1 protoporphyrinogen oxidase 2-like [Dendrobium catenatum]